MESALMMIASGGIGTPTPTAVINPSFITTIPFSIFLPGPCTIVALVMAYVRPTGATGGFSSGTWLCPCWAELIAGQSRLAKKIGANGRNFLGKYLIIE